MARPRQNQSSDKTEPDKGKLGRPPKYDPRFCDVAKKLFEIGGTDADLAMALGVNRRTLFRWRIDHPEFLSHCRMGTEAADKRVEASFYQRAVGYERKAIKVLSYEGRSWEHEFVEEVQADVTAGKFWLTNRQPDRWRDSQTIKHDAEDGSALDLLAKSLAGCVLKPKEE